jgi:MHS family proline/betaine transporter-like MFS transporter
MAFMGGKTKVMISGMLGNGLEWYDYALYGHMSVVFAKLFFAEGSNEGHNLILTFLIFASGFVARPLGAIFFGRLGDKYGRKKALTISMILMAIPTGAIGLLPTYEMVGMLAPVLLLIIRMLQGFSLGGVYSGSISYMVEHAPADRRSTIGSMIKVSLIIGFLLGSLVSTIFSNVLSHDAFFQWGWRVPFFFGIAIGFVGYYIRDQGEESPVYEQAKKAGMLSSNPVRDAFLKYPTKMLRGFMIYIYVTVPFYLLAIYMIAYTKLHLGLSESAALLINSISMLCMLLPIYPAARIADKIGRKPVLLTAIMVMIVVAYPAFTYMQSGLQTHMEITALPDGTPIQKVIFDHAANFTHVLLAQCIMTALLGWYLAPIPATLVEIFPTSVRNTGMSLSYNICAILGGFTPSFAEFLINGAGKDNGLVRFFGAQHWDGLADFTTNGTGDITSIQWVVIGSGVLTFISLLLYKDRWREPLPA